MSCEFCKGRHGDGVYWEGSPAPERDWILCPFCRQSDKWYPISLEEHRDGDIMVQNEEGNRAAFRRRDANA